MGGRYLNAALYGLGCGLVFGLVGYWGIPEVIGPAMGVGLVVGLVVEALASAAAKRGGKPIDYTIMGLIGFACTLAACVILGLTIFWNLGELGAFIPAFFLVPIFTLAWGPRWYLGVRSSVVIKKLGKEHVLRNLLAIGAALGFAAGLLTKSPFFGVFFLMLLGAAVGAVIWMDADESMRRQSG